MRRLEPAFWAVALALLALAVGGEGRRRVALERRVAVAPRELYRTLARSRQALQLVDIRAGADGYDDAHLPGALPVPGCDLDRAAPAVRDRLLRSAPTVVISASGEGEEVRACLSRFSAARSLAGGMPAWSAAGLPEDVGDYAPPPVRVGGGCL